MLLLFLAAHDTRKKRRETLIKSVLAVFMEMPLYRRITSIRWDLYDKHQWDRKVQLVY